MTKLPSPDRLNGLDTLRALAITMVFLFHYGNIFPHPQWAQPAGKFGWTGVDLFFVLSGYLISSQLLQQIQTTKRISLRQFFAKRFFRIVPPYLLILAIYFFIPVSRERDSIAPLWKYLTFTQNIGLDLRHQATFSHAWSLCIEEQFYLSLPLALMALLYFKQLKKGVIILLILFLGGLIARALSWRHFVFPNLLNDDVWVWWHKWIYYPTWCRLDGLLVGVSIAVALKYTTLAQKIVRYGNALLLCSVAVLTGAYFLCNEQQSFYSTVFGFPLVDIGFGIFLLSAITPSCFLYSVQSRSIRAIATYSYALYLVHKIIIHAVQNLAESRGIDKESNLTFLVCTILCLAAAAIIHYLVERPSLRLRDRVLSMSYFRRAPPLFPDVGNPANLGRQAPASIENPGAEFL